MEIYSVSRSNKYKANTNAIADYLAKYAYQRLPSIECWYLWKVNEDLAKKYKLNKDLNAYKLCKDFKRSAGDKLQAYPNRRFAVARDIVEKWGGINKNGSNTLRRYANLNFMCRPPKDIRGISSWSKVVSIHNPRKFAIFDSRVSCSLNSIQILARVKNGIRFPKLSTQNGDIKSFAFELHEHIDNLKWDSNFPVYETYINILIKAKEKLNRRNRRHSIQDLEMLLFSWSPALALEALTKLR